MTILSYQDQFKVFVLIPNDEVDRVKQSLERNRIKFENFGVYSISPAQSIFEIVCDGMRGAARVWQIVENLC